MLPTLFLQPSDFANFDIELNGPNLLPQDAIEPEVAFAEILSLGAGIPLEPVPVTGQELPASGNPLPAIAAEPGTDLPAAVDDASPDPAHTAVPWPQPPILQPTAQSAPPESRPVAPALVLDAETPPAPATGTPERGPVPAAVAATLEASTRLLTRPGNSPDPLAAAAPTAPRATALPLPANVTPQALAVLPGVAAQPATEIPGSMRTQVPAAPSLARAAKTLPDAARSVTLDPNPGETARELRAPVATTTAPVVTTAQTAPPPAAEATSLNALQTSAVSTGQPPVSTPASTTSPDLSLAARIDVPVRDPAWGEQLGQRLQLMANNQVQTAEIRLTPAELGPLRVQIAMDDGAASVTFQAQHALTREAIEQALPRLREMLAENGLTLSQANVGEQDVQHGSRDGAEATELSYRGGDGAAEVPLDELRERGDRVAVGLVDTFA